MTIRHREGPKRDIARGTSFGSLASIMTGITIATSKPGRIWPTGYWKSLIDSFCRGGTKINPHLRYPAFSRYISPLVYEAKQRFVPTKQSQLVGEDDTAISSIRVIRVKPGADSLIFHSPAVPDSAGWPLFEFPYFGTIGSSKYEQQIKENRVALCAREQEFLCRPSTGLWLHFQLSTARRDRDLDNLADALMPLFNELLPNLGELRLSKSLPHVESTERLWVSTDFESNHAAAFGAG